MKKVFAALFGFLCIVSLAQGVCLFGGRKHMQIYKHLNMTGDALRVDSADSCKNFISKTTEYVSGKAMGVYSCTVWEESKCKGKSVLIDSAGKNFGFFGKSMRCPCWGKICVDTEHQYD